MRNKSAHPRGDSATVHTARARSAECTHRGALAHATSAIVRSGERLRTEQRGSDRLNLQSVALPKLTSTQLATLVAIRDFVRLRGFSPSTDQLAGQFGVTYATIRHRLEALLRKGLLERPVGGADRYRKVELTSLGGMVASMHGRLLGSTYRFVAPVRERGRVVFPRVAS
jgi:DNA-binding MarR family transcriptional regulator